MLVDIQFTKTKTKYDMDTRIRSNRLHDDDPNSKNHNIPFVIRT